MSFWSRITGRKEEEEDLARVEQTPQTKKKKVPSFIQVHGDEPPLSPPPLSLDGGPPILGSPPRPPISPPPTAYRHGYLHHKATGYTSPVSHPSITTTSPMPTIQIFNPATFAKEQVPEETKEVDPNETGGRDLQSNENAVDDQDVLQADNELQTPVLVPKLSPPEPPYRSNYNSLQSTKDRGGSEEEPVLLAPQIHPELTFNQNQPDHDQFAETTQNLPDPQHGSSPVGDEVEADTKATTTTDNSQEPNDDVAEQSKITPEMNEQHQDEPSEEESSEQGDFVLVEAADSEHADAHACSKSGGFLRIDTGGGTVEAISTDLVPVNPSDMITPLSQAISPSRFEFLSDQKDVSNNIRKFERQTIRRRREFQKIVHDLECRLGMVQAKLANEAMDRDQDLCTLLDKKISPTLEMTTERLMHERHRLLAHRNTVAEDFTKPSLSSVHQRVSRLGTQMTHHVHVEVQELKRDELLSLRDQLQYEIIPEMRLEASKADKREVSINNRFEAIAGEMCRNYREEFAERRSSLKEARVTNEPPKETSEHLLAKIRELRAKLRRDRVERRAQDQRIRERIDQTAKLMKRALLNVTVPE